MSRWQIRCLYFFSHDNRRVDVPFELSAVNIIVGVPFSGKSALIDVLDYCMGAGTCHIPLFVRTASAWVGVLWANGREEILICRRVPKYPNKSSEDVFFRKEKLVEVPKDAASLSRTSNVDSAMKQFEMALRIGDVKGTTFTEREGKRISFRNAMPYLVQSDNVIINKDILFPGADDERKLSIIDTIPYYLGAVDEQSAADEARLELLIAKRDKLLRAQDAAQQQHSETSDQAKALLSEAAQLGMVASEVLDAEPSRVLQFLQLVASWSPSPTTDTERDQLDFLYREERVQRSRVSKLRTQLSAATEALKSVNHFAASVETQHSKLDVVSLFRPDSERETCPICDSPLHSVVPSVRTIRQSLDRLSLELVEAGQDRPQIDSYVARLNADLEVATAALTTVKSQVAAVIRESEETEQKLELDQRRMRIVGRASYFLESRVPDTDRGAVKSLKELEKEIESLQSRVDIEAKMERLQAIETQVSTEATLIMKELPFDANYREFSVNFLARKLSVKFVRGQRTMEMRDIGGDESYLTGHVATILALHRIFAVGERPVPGVVIFDQLSRPFYQPDDHPGEVELSLLDSPDRNDLKQYFDVIFKEVAQQQNLQVIILEHAYFQDDPRYVAAVRRRWNNTDKLIPADWPHETTPEP